MFDAHTSLGHEAHDELPAASRSCSVVPPVAVSDPGGDAREAVNHLVAGLRSLVDSCQPGDLLLPDAVALVEQLTTAERLIAVMRGRAAVTVAESPAAWRARGDRSAGHWLARVMGSSVADAIAVLDTTKQLPSQPAVADAFEAGGLSARQAALISSTITEVEKSLDSGTASSESAAIAVDLLHHAATASISELRDRCIATRIKHLPDADARHRDIHRRRSARFRTAPDGARELIAHGTPDDMAEIAAAIARHRKTVFDRARKEGRRERSDSHDFDALLELARSVDDPGAAPSSAADGDGDERAASASRKRRRRGPKVMIVIGEETLHQSTSANQSPSAPPAAPDPDPAPSPPGRPPPTSGSRKPTSGPPPEQTPSPPPPEPPVGATPPLPTPASPANVLGHGLIPATRVAELIAHNNAEVHAIVTRGDGESAEVVGIANLGRARADGSHPALAGAPALHQATRTKLIDVTGSHNRRPANAAQSTALDFRDPQCTVEGCEQHQRLETDHRTGWVKTHTTAFGDLDRLCGMHHWLKTHLGYTLAPGTGKRPMLPP